MDKIGGLAPNSLNFLKDEVTRLAKEEDRIMLKEVVKEALCEVLRDGTANSAPNVTNSGYDTYVKQQLQRREYELEIAKLKEERDNLRAHFMELNKESIMKAKDKSGE